MPLDIVILSTVSQEKAIKLGSSLNEKYEDCTVHVFAEIDDDEKAFEKIKSAVTLDGVLFLDEFSNPKEETIYYAMIAQGIISFEMKIAEGCTINSAIKIPREALLEMDYRDFFSLVWENEEVSDKYEVEVEKDGGNYHRFFDSELSYFIGNKIKKYVSEYGDASLIEDLSGKLNNNFFLSSSKDNSAKYNKEDEGLCKKISDVTPLGNINFLKDNYMPSGRGLILVPAAGIGESFGVRLFSKSIYEQTYKDFDILCFGDIEDVKDISKYILDSTKFKFTELNDFDFVNEVIKENKYDWYFIANHKHVYDKRTIELCLSQGKDTVLFAMEPKNIENGAVCGPPSLDHESIFVKRRLLMSIGYFDPINKMGILEMINRLISLDYQSKSLMPIILSQKLDITLNFKIDRTSNIRAKYVKCLSEPYPAGSSYNGKSLLFENIPAELKVRSLPIDTGNLNVSRFIVRTLMNKGRLDNIKVQISKFKIKNAETWLNIRKDSEEIDEITSEGLVSLKNECYQCSKEVCDHRQRLITRGQIANFHSMMKLFENIIETGCDDQDLFLICEDDVVFRNNFVSVFNEMIERDEIKSNLDKPIIIKVGWGDMLEYRRDHYDEFLENFELRENFKRFANPCFAVNKLAIEHYLSEFKSYDRPCDQWVQIDIGMSIKNITIYPPLCSELSHVGLIDSDMHPKCSQHEWEHLMYVKTGNIEHLDRASKLKDKYDNFWRSHDEKQQELYDKQIGGK